MSGELTITATSSDPFLININSLDLQNAAGLAANFDPTVDQSWTFVTASGGISGFDISRFLVDWSGFQNDTLGGTFSVAQLNGNSLAIQFSAIPEPTSLLLVLLVSSCGMLRRGHRRTYLNKQSIRSLSRHGFSIQFLGQAK